LIVSEGGDKQPLAFEIHAEMVKPPFHVRHGDLLNKLEQ
jgi:hypothetical protein